MEVVLTGLRTNGEYHLGNYLGALMPMVTFAREKSKDYQINLFAPDLHSFTTPIEFGDSFKTQTFNNLKLFVAAGIPLDNPNVYMYRQSYIPAHSEMTWLLDNFTGYGEMARMVEFKEKAERTEEERVSVGLFNYPVLMASDILLYDAVWVPVGEDQRQHLEFARTIAERINNQFGDIFTVPQTLAKQQEFVGRTEAPRVRSLRNPSKKMSKSVDDPNGTILLSDSPDEAYKKIMAAETDSHGSVNYDWLEQPGISNLLQILILLSDKPQEEVASSWKGSSKYGDLKKAVAEEVAQFLTNLQKSYNNVDESALLAHLESSETEMNKRANAKVQTLQKAIGLR